MIDYNQKTITDKELLEIDNGFCNHINPFIYSGYRIPCNDYLKSFLSIFYLHNEFVNIWTHLLGSFLFICIFIFWYLQNYNDTPPLKQISISIFFLSVIFLLSFSTTYHISVGHSVEKANDCLCLDWFGVSLIIFGYSFFISYFELYEYGFKNSFFIFNTFLIGFMLLTSQYIKESLDELHHDIQDNDKDNKNDKDLHQHTIIRTIIIILYSLSAISAWFIHYLLEGRNMDSQMKNHLIGILFTYLANATVLFKVSCIPERFSPHTFDIFGYSHQIFHVGVVCGALILWNTYC